MTIKRREPNIVTTVNGFLRDPNTPEPVEQTEVWQLGHWEMHKLQEGLEALTGDAKDHMAFFAHLIGASGGDVEITITRKWKA